MMDLNVLLVDDEPDFIGTLAKRLKRRGLTAHVAGSGEEGLELLARESVDVVVLDMKMPGLDGLDTLERILEDHPGKKVIFLTGHANTTDGVRGMKHGAFDYVAKPVELDVLLEKIHQADAEARAERLARLEAAHRERVEKRAIATDRLASLGRLATGVAHEINNPLSIIRESAGLLADILQLPALDDMPYRERFEHALQQVDVAVERASQITHQLLGLVLDEEAPDDECDLALLVERVVDLYASSARRQKVKLVADVDMALTPIPVDPSSLRQIFVNLVGNALYASPEGSTVTLRITPVDDRIRAEFEDQGPGIPADNLLQIFEPFWSTRSQGEGSGLGLYVTRRLLESLGGTIEVQSEEGQGTTVVVTLPMKDAAAA